MELTAPTTMDFTRPATAGDAVDGLVPRCVAEPGSTAQVATLLQRCNADGLRVVARGGGTKLDWGNPPRGVEVILSTKKLDGVIEHASGDLTTTVQAGCTVGALQAALSARGQRLALDPLWPDRSTIGGIIATNDSGALRATYGTLRDHLIGITVVLADGTIARSGGKVVKNVAGYDLPKLFTGSFGTLGIITEATFRLYSIPHSTQTISFAVPTTESLNRFIAVMSRLSLVTMAVEIQIAQNNPITASVLIGGHAAAMDDKRKQVIQAASECGVVENLSDLNSLAPVRRGEGWGEGRIGNGSNLSDRPSPHPSPPSTGERECWSAREQLFAGAESCIAQISLLPTKWPAFIDRMREIASGNCEWKIVAQIVGVGTMRITSLQAGTLPEAIRTIRNEVEQAGGSLIILRCPVAMKSQVNVWPDCGDALPLMRRIKEQFDPRGILAPGRFVGGI
jgi:glycolate oxidase FAD binding subunit